MTAPELLAHLQATIPHAVDRIQLDAIDPFAVIHVQHLHEVALFLRDDALLKLEMLNCITGVDYLEPEAKKLAKAGFEPHLEVVYHLSSMTLKHRFTFKIILPRWKNDTLGELPEVPSIADVYPAADWHERETYDLCGIYFTNHPDLRRILLAEDWEGHPLRKDYQFPLEYHNIRCR